MEGLLWTILCYSLISFSSKFSIAADTLTSHQSISEGQTLVSSGQVFELGFFSPPTSKNRYLGIWYKNIPPTVVWVANRENPMTDLSGALNISKDGNLVLFNGNGNIFWTSNSARATKSPIAQILDSGNLVAKDANDSNSGSYLWQSFDYPTDTLLPGMKLGWDLKTGLNRKLTSWKTLDDPSPGTYSYGVELGGLPQIVLRMGLKKQYRSGLWYQNQFSGENVLTANAIFKPIFVANMEKVYFTFVTIDAAIETRFVVGQSGFVQYFTWNHRQRQWVILYSIQKDHCDTYNLCGPFGTCDIDESPNCKCMKGFTPKSPQDWEVFDTFGGCSRTSPLDCRKEEGFVKYPGMKLPDTLNMWANATLSTKECEVACLKNCSCIAYAKMTLDGRGCSTWSGDLIDIREAKYGSGQDLYVRLSAAELKLIADSQKRRRKRLRLIVSFSVFSVMLLLALIFWCLVWKKKKKTSYGGLQTKEEDWELPLFDLITIATATENFSHENMIGQGGFGPVYKGQLSMGQEIAAKRLSKNSTQGLEEFKNEVNLIARLQHRNLVRLLGCCIEGEERMLIYEYMPNKSLDYFIFGQNRSALLVWQMRFDIVMGIAWGLLYLHQDSRLRIIHRDLKTSNILLDGELNPKISDFGLARIFVGDQIEAKTKRVIGTYGYMSPEYAIDGKFSLKSDVFSFGVLLLEIVSGKKNRGFCHPDHPHNLLGHAWLLWYEEKALEVIDACLEDSCVESQVLRCIHVALLCVQKTPEDRPAMSSVAFMLDNEDATLPQPKQPGFFIERSSINTDTLTDEERCHTVNVVTITMLEAR